MAMHVPWVFVFGLLGNVISCFVCLAPLPTFYQICKKKTSDGFQSIPYVVALFSAMLWLFYAIFQKDTTLLITINSFTFCMQLAYISVYLFYATNKDKILTVKLFLFFNVFGFGAITIVALFLTQGEKRVKLLGWICMIFAFCVFVAPLGILRKVIKTKSVEFMPFYLSFFLTLSAVMWFFFGFLKKDLFIAVPNILGFIFGIIQMVLYVIYRKPSKNIVEELKLQELPQHIVDVAKLTAILQENNVTTQVVVVVENQNPIKEETNKQEEAAAADDDNASTNNNPKV